MRALLEVLAARREWITGVVSALVVAGAAWLAVVPRWRPRRGTKPATSGLVRDRQRLDAIVMYRRGQ